MTMIQDTGRSDSKRRLATRYRIQDKSIMHRASCIMQQRSLIYYLMPLLLLFTIHSTLGGSLFTNSAEAAQVAGKITKIAGRVDILRAGTTVAVPVNVGDSVSIGDILRTKSDGKAEILFIDKSVMTVGPKSRLGIDEYLYKPDEERRSASLKLYRGKTGFKVPKPVYPAAGSKFEMKTRTAVAGVRGTEGILFTDGVERVFIREGIVEFSNPLGRVMVTSGRVGEIFYGRAPSERPYQEREFRRHEVDVAPKVTDKMPEKKEVEKPAPPPVPQPELVAPPAIPSQTSITTVVSTTTTPTSEVLKPPTQPTVPVTEATGQTVTNTTVNVNVIYPNTNVNINVNFP